MRLLLLTLLAGLLGFAAGSWQRSQQVPATEPTPMAPATSSPNAPASPQSPATTTASEGAPVGEAKSLRERLKELARSRNPLAAAAEAQALIAKLTLEDFRELAAQPKEFPFPYSTRGEGAIYSRAYMDALVRRWLEVDPEGGTAAMRALDESLVIKREGKSTSAWSGHGMLRDALARFRPTPPVAIAEAFASGARQWKDSSSDASAAFEELARTDPARANALADRISDKTGQIMARMAVQKGSVRETDPVEVARVGRSSDTVSKAFAAAAEQGPEKLRAALEASIFKLIDTTALVAEGVMRNPDLPWDTIPGEFAGKPDRSYSAGSQSTAQMLARQLSPEDRQRALAAADRLATEWRAAVLQPLVAAWALDEPRAALEWVAQKSERSDAAFAAFGPWLVSEADAALAWVEKSAPPEVRQALSGHLVRTFEAGEKVRQGPLGPAMFDRAPAEARATAAALLEHSPAAAARLVAELPTAEPAGSAFQPIFEKWLDRDAAAAAQWLEAQPASRRRDEAVAAFATVAAPRDAEGAAQWVPTIADPALRKKAVESVFRAMELRDPAAARAWRESLAPPP